MEKAMKKVADKTMGIIGLMAMIFLSIGIITWTILCNKVIGSIIMMIGFIFTFIFFIIMMINLINFDD